VQSSLVGGGGMTLKVDEAVALRACASVTFTVSV
jgi:hypothetical protein